MRHDESSKQGLDFHVHRRVSSNLKISLCHETIPYFSSPLTHAIDDCDYWREKGIETPNTYEMPNHPAGEWESFLRVRRKWRLAPIVVGGLINQSVSIVEG